MTTTHGMHVPTRGNDVVHFNSMWISVSGYKSQVRAAGFWTGFSLILQKLSVIVLLTEIFLKI